MTMPIYSYLLVMLETLLSPVISVLMYVPLELALSSACLPHSCTGISKGKTKFGVSMIKLPI